jgi:serine protease
MKRWVWLGLVGLLAACKEEEQPEPPPVEPQDCTSTSENALPPGLSSLSQELDSEEPSEAATDGRRPMLIRYRRTLSASSATQAAATAVTRTGGVVTAQWARLGAVAARLTPEEQESLAGDPDVLSIEPDRVVRAFARTPPVTSGGVGEYTEGLKMIQVPDVWDANLDGIVDTLAPIGSGIKVCVIDSGWDNRHPELKAAYIGGKDFVDDDDEPLDQDKLTGKWGGGHGTHTAATIVAQLASAGTVDPADDANGVVGVAPGVELLVARVLNIRGNGSTSDIISAMQWCKEQGARIASLSLGAPEDSAAERTAFEQALADGILSIAATGNSGTGDPVSEPPVAYPAAYPSVLAVGAVNFESEHPSFSQVGPPVALVAPGVGVLSAMIMGSESFSTLDVNGQSFETRSLAFAPVGEYTGKVLTCGTGAAVDSCGSEATCAGFVAYVDRGGTDAAGSALTFAKKVANMRKAGAKAVIIGNNDPDDGVGNFTLVSEGSWVPTTSVSFKDGATIKGLRGSNAKVKLTGVDYARLTGTSMATPHVAGVAALVWSSRPTLAPAQVREVLEKSAKDLGTPGRDQTYGHGLVQAKAAMTKLRELHPTP